MWKCQIVEDVVRQWLRFKVGRNGNGGNDRFCRKSKIILNFSLEEAMFNLSLNEQ